jgi:uncharacterized protein YndB with AHSA1/START domain
MRWVVYAAGALLALVVVAVVVLLALGGARGQARHVRTLEIDRPAAVVFTWITEPDRLESWVGWLVEVQGDRAMEIVPGRTQVWVMEDRNNNNQRMNIHTVVTRVERDRLLEAQLNIPGTATGTVTYELQPLDSKRTHLTYRATYQYQHWLARLLEPVISRAAEQKLGEDLNRLKERVEAE